MTLNFAKSFYEYIKLSQRYMLVHVSTAAQYMYKCLYVISNIFNSAVTMGENSLIVTGNSVIKKCQNFCEKPLNNIGDIKRWCGKHSFVLKIAIIISALCIIVNNSDQHRHTVYEYMQQIYCLCIHASTWCNLFVFFSCIL